MMRACYLILLAGLAGCASQPQIADIKEPAPTPAATAAAAPAPQAAPEQAAAAAPAPTQAHAAEEDPSKVRVPPGYKQRKKDGETVYCKKETVLGSRFPTDVCMTAAQLAEMEDRNAAMRNNLEQAQRMCTSAAGCANQ